MKKIGIDLTSLQGPHRMRGIGYTLLNFINHMPKTERRKYSFVFYVLPTDGGVDPLTLLRVHDMDYEVREIKPRRRSQRSLPGRLQMLISAFNQLVEIRDLHFGDSRFSRKNLKDVGIYLQTDPAQGLPKKLRLKKCLVVYDVIPYAVDWEYLWPYSYARHKQGFSRKASLRCHVRRWLYAYKYRVVLRRANKLIVISEHTKDDFMRYFSVPKKKIVASPLGVSPPSVHSNEEIPRLHQYVKTSWGYMKRPLELDPGTPFLLFVGGADRRRKIEDLVAAFNQVRAAGHNVKLVLAGDSMQGPEDIATEEIQTALKRCSYLDDIIFMGFVDDSERDWLYRHACAFVFPSRYEGFGLPVLEAMIHECPVISYHNSATNEVAGDVPVYASDILSLKDAMLKMCDLSGTERQKLVNKGLKQAEKFSWENTSRAYLEIINK